LTIHYPHHPQFGQAVTLVRRVSFSGQPRDQLQVELPNGFQLVVPEWMFDEERCCGMEIVAQPVLALSALQALRDLMGAQLHTSEQRGSIASEASSTGGACCEPTTPGSSSLGDSNDRGASLVSADALSRVAQPDDARSCERNNRRGE